MCLVDDCDKNVSSVGLCGAHRPTKLCVMGRCTTTEVARCMRGRCRCTYTEHLHYPYISLNPTPPRPLFFKAVKLCSEDGCSNKAPTRKYGSTHVSRRICAVEGCTTTSCARGVCTKHGARGECKVINCTTNAEKVGGNCGKHGGRAGFCADPDCYTPAVPGTLVCTRHGANGICNVWGCSNNANTRGRGVCRAHDIKVLCSTPDCLSRVVARGLCVKHGAYGVCSTVGCVTSAVARSRGLCYKHGALGFCSFGNCKTAATSIGRCVRHGGGTAAPKNECKVNGCNNREVVRGLCIKHGAYGTCTTKGCSATARQGPLQHCSKHGGGAYKPCSVAGCITTARRKGLCHKHGGGPGQCYASNCTKLIVGMWKTCAEHGGYGECKHPSDCMCPAVKVGGNCKKHTE